MLSFNIAAVLQARGIEKPYSYLIKSGFTHTVAHRLVYNKPRILRLDHVELLCQLLVCSPHDLMVWTPEKDRTYPPDHPLYTLSRPAAIPDWKQTLATMPYDQFKTIVENIAEKKKDDTGDQQQ